MPKENQRGTNTCFLIYGGENTTHSMQIVSQFVELQ